MIRYARLAALFVGGAVLGVLFDQIHVIGGVLFYREPFFPNQAWWVGPQFGAATVTAVLCGRPFVRGHHRLARSVVKDGLWFLAAYLATAAFKGFAPAVCVGLVATWVVRVWLSPGRQRVVLYSVALSLIGTGYEAALTGAGLFSYTSPDFINVPIWLPALYLHAGILALALAGSVHPATADRTVTSPRWAE